MAFTHRMQGSRFELKYVISEPCARAVRDFSLSYLVPDPHADPARNCEYPVHSLYLDSRNLRLFWATVRGLTNRYKLRIRYYDDSPESPVFLEIKQRLNDVILKSRAPIRRSAVARIINGHWPAPEDVMDVSPRGLAALSQFHRLRNMLEADGVAVVSYVREAYVTPHDDNVRVTFDRRIRGFEYVGRGSLARTGRSAMPDIGGVVLEIKFTDRFPVWLRALVRHFNLERRSMAKYVNCVEGLRALAEPVASVGR